MPVLSLLRTAPRFIPRNVLKRYFAMDFYDRNKSPYYKPTVNSHGHMLNMLDEYGTEFVEFARTCKKPVADLGVAFGFTTKKLLETGATVYANDLSTEMLDEFYASLTDEERQRCILKPGSALDLDFPSESLGGIMALRWFHFLTGDQVRVLLKKFYTWLAPGGKVVITTSSPYSGRSKGFIPEYEQRKVAGEEWPGFTTKRIQEVGGPRHREFFHKIDPEILGRELRLAGFDVEKIGYLARDFYPPDWQGDGRDHTAAVAVKPPH